MGIDLHGQTRFRQIPTQQETLGLKPLSNPQRPRTQAGIGGVTPRMLVSEEAMGESVHRPGSAPIWANQRRIHGHHTGMVAHLGPQPFPQRLVSQGPPGFQNRSTRTIGLNQADSVPVTFTPGQIDPHHQHGAKLACAGSGASDTSLNKMNSPLPFLEDESRLEERSNTSESPR